MTSNALTQSKGGISRLDKAVEMATPQSLVHIKHSISLQQYKYFLLLFDEMCFLMDSGIEPDINGFYNMRMEKLVEKIGYKPNKKDIWDDFVMLKNETIAVNYLMKDGQPIRYGAGYISEWAISNSLIKFRFPSFFIEVAKKFKEQRRLFLQLNWDIFNSFSGKYEAILYKLCKDYENSGGKRTPEFSIEGFREYMGINDKEYPLFKDLNKFCISKPLSKINNSDISDIAITPHLVRTGKFITSIYFSIQSKTQQSLPIETAPLDDPFMLARVPIPMNVQSDFLKLHTLEDAKLCIQAANEWIDAKVKAGETVIHGKAYRMALKDNWKPNHLLLAEQEIIKQEAEAKKAEEARKAKEQEKQTELENNNKNRNLITSMRSKFELLPEEEQEKIKNEFIATRPDTTIVKKYGVFSKSYEYLFSKYLESIFIK